MKKLFTILTIALCSTLAMAQTNQYFWAGGQFIMGNPINQIDSITFGQLENTDSIMLYFPHTVKVIHDTVIQYVNIHDTIYQCDNHEYVDLGLSVKWATCNIGATIPEGYGDYFAWGETSPKTDYSWSTYKHSNGSETTITKYCSNNSYGKVDNKTTLEAEDDAASVNWGGKWRMPTHAEQEELGNPNNCIWEKSIRKGINGYVITSKINGNSIFLPTAGFYDGVTYTNDMNVNGSYWSASLYTSLYPWEIGFLPERIYYGNRSHGLTIRAVCQ